MKFERKKIFFYLFVGIFTIGLLYILFNEYGFVKYSKLSSQVDSIKSEINSLKTENENLKNEIDSLKRKIPAKMEELAREKYDMVKPNEVTVEIEKEKQ
jgi:cell division protein FtsL